MNRLPNRRRTPPRGYTFVELTIVVLLLGILAGLAAPRLLSVSAEAEAAAVVTNVRRIFDAAERFEAEHGYLPVNALPPATSPDFEGYLPNSLFTTPSPFGGVYDWNGLGTSVAYIGVQIIVTGTDAVSARAAYKALEKADDGSPKTGWIRVNSRTIHFRLADKP